MKIARETALLTLISIADMLSTLWLVEAGLATEANPIMLFYLNAGISAFVGAKFLFLFAPVYGFWVISRKRPHLARVALRGSILLYLLVYCVGSWQVNATAAVRSASARYDLPRY